MAYAIERPGTFRGVATEHTVNTTKNGFPQWVARLSATEFFDEETQQWMDWSPYNQEILAYLVLFSDKGPCLNHEQVQKATGWPADSFSSLAALDLTSRPLQFRVEENVYNGSTTLKVNWVDAADAAPGRTLKKLDDGALKALDAKYNLKAAPKPAKAPAKATAKAPPKPVVPTATTPIEPPDAADALPEPQTPPKPVVPTATAPAKGKKAKVAGSVESCTKGEAWAKLCELKTEDCTDEVLSAAWIEAFDAVAGEIDEAEATPKQWAAILAHTLRHIPHIPF